jgi:hypothetical protein
MQEPVIMDVTINKQGRHWSVKTDGELLAVVLYRKGAEAVQELVQRLAGLPVTADAKPKPAAKKSPAKDVEPAKPTVEPVIAA